MKKLRSIIAILVSVAAMLAAPDLAAQTVRPEPSGPAMALNGALVAACREVGTDFANYLTTDNAAAFLKLPAGERTALMRRFVLLGSPGRPLLSTDAQGHMLLLCETDDATARMNFGATLLRDNLAYIPVTVTGDQSTQFTLVRENGKWKLLSVGLLMLDIPELEKQWAAQALQEREQGAIDTLHNLAEAIDTYNQAFNRLPDTLAQLGPSKDGVSPDGAKLIDAKLAAGEENGYKFRYRVNTPPGSGSPSYEIEALPSEYGKTGRRSFLLDTAGKIHGADKQGGLATTDDPVVSSATPGNS